MCIATIVYLLTSGKVGSASDYSLELIAALSLLAGLGVQWLCEQSSLQRDLLVAVMVLVLAPLVVQTAQALNTAQTWQNPGGDDRPVMALEAVRRGPILSDNGYILLHGADPPVMLDPFYFSVLQTLGRWDEQPLARMV